MFIVFEGLDGSGQSTQAKLLAERLTKMGKKAVLTKEPTDKKPLGTLIRSILQHKSKVSPEAFQLLFCADRADHLKNEIEPALAKGKIVISDRYFFSTIAYGSLACDVTWLKELNKNFRKPDLIFYLKIDPKISLERIEKRGNTKELFEEEQKLRIVARAYDKLASENRNVCIIEADHTLETVHEKIWEKMGSLL